MKKTVECIPKNALGLVEAYNLVLRAVVRNLDDLHEALDEDNPCSSTVCEEDAIADLQRAQRKANYFFREKLVGSELFAYIRDPRTAEDVSLPGQGWQMPTFNEATAIFSNYVAPGDLYEPGPAEATVGGQQMPVFLYKDEFEKWFVATFGDNPKHRLGRPPGSGSYDAMDQPHLEEMHGLLRTNQAKSIWEAACKVAPHAKGASYKANRHRLFRSYKRRRARNEICSD